MNRYFKVRELFLLTAAMIGSEVAFSCEFHGGYGFGTQPGRFNNVRSYSSNSVKARDIISPRNWLKLTTPPMISADLSKKTEIKVEYQMLEASKNIQLSLETGPEISVINANHTQINAESGLYTFTLIPSKAGTFRLIIVANASADNDTNPKTLREVVYLSAT